MDELLAALEKGPPKTALYGLAAIAVVLMSGGAWAAARHLRRPQCTELAAHWGPTWDDAQRQATSAAFSRSGVLGAAGIFATADRMMQAYRAEWIAMATDACRATRVGVSSPRPCSTDAWPAWTSGGRSQVIWPGSSSRGSPRSSTRRQRPWPSWRRSTAAPTSRPSCSSPLSRKGPRSELKCRGSPTSQTNSKPWSTPRRPGCGCHLPPRGRGRRQAGVQAGLGSPPIPAGPRRRCSRERGGCSGCVSRGRRPGHRGPGRSECVSLLALAGV